MFSIFAGDNPAHSASNEYTPGCSNGKVKIPSSFVVVCRFNPVAWLEMLMTTWGTTAPLASITVPLSVALLVWAPAIELRHKKYRANTTHKTANVFRFILSLLMLRWFLSERRG